MNAYELAHLEPSSPPALSYLDGRPVYPALSFRVACQVGLAGTYLDDRFACLVFSFPGADQDELAGTYQGDTLVDPERSLLGALDALLDHQVRLSAGAQSCCE